MFPFLLGLAALLAVVHAAPNVTIGNTRVNGVDAALQTEFFAGLPFAEPPTGTRRLANPVPVTNLSGTTFDATRYRAPCIQSPAVPNMSEDCLTLNVLRPKGTAANASLPVMVWVYGGGFTVGFAEAYNGSVIVDQSRKRGTPIIFVTLNYRLGPFGWPTGTEAESRGSLNLGMKDVIAALQWVQTNIRSFGGDRSKVTIFGESAGAILISNLFLNSKLETLVRGAILESGAQGTTPLWPASSGTEMWQIMAKQVPACKNADLKNNSFTCLRNATVAQIQAAAEFADDYSSADFPWVPVIDGGNNLIPELASNMLANSRFASVPFIAGANLDEGTSFVPTNLDSATILRNYMVGSLTPVSTFRMLSRLSRVDIVVDRLMDLYPDDPSLGSPYGTGPQTFGFGAAFKRGAAILGDAAFHSLRRAFNRAAAKKGVRSWGYLFSEQSGEPSARGVGHGDELQFVFGYVSLGGDSAEARLSVAMMDYWISFASSLDPNDGRGSQRPNWPSYASTSPVIIELNSGNLRTIPDDFRREQMDFISQSSSTFRHRRRELFEHPHLQLR